MNSEYNIDIHISNIYSLLPSELFTSISNKPSTRQDWQYSARLDLNTDGPRSF